MTRRRTHLVLATTLGLTILWFGQALLRQRSVERALLDAVDRHDVAAVTSALARGASPNTRDERGDTALLRAVGRGDEAIIALLLHRGADVNASGADRLTALMWAARLGREETVVLLVKSGADVNARNFNGDTALTMFETEPMRSVVTGERHTVIHRLLEGRPPVR
jgi:hypothetical protein